MNVAYFTSLCPYCWIFRFLQMFPIINNTPYLHWPSHPFFSHLPLHSHLGPYCDQKLLHLWALKPRLPALWLRLPILQFSHSVTLSTPVLWSPAFFFFSVNWLLPNSHDPSFLPPSSFLLWARHCTKCRGCKVVGVNPSTCWLPCPLPFCKSSICAVQTFHRHFHFASQITFLSLTQLPLSATALQNIAHDCPFHFPGLHQPLNPL